MKTYFVDTNVFVHTLFTVSPREHAACVKLFALAAKDAVHVWTTSWVLAELVWLLMRQKMSRAEIRRLLLVVIASEGLDVLDRDVIMDALDGWGERLDFIDSMNVVLAKKNGIGQVISFDKDFDGLPDIERFEPKQIVQ